MAKMAILEYTGSLPFPRLKPHIRTHKCHFNHEYTTVEYRQLSFLNFQCVKIIVDIIQVSFCLNMAQVIMSRFFHGGFFTVNSLLMYVRHINVYNTDVGTIASKIVQFQPKFVLHCNFKLFLVCLHKQVKS